jgi:ATP-binding cassette subfamily A (ABC1) protein 3
MVDMYKNSKFTSYCEKPELVCSTIKNPCCKYKNQGQDNPCGTRNCIDWSKDYLIWDRPGLSKYLVFMTLQFFIQFSFLLLHDTGYFRLISYRLKSLLGFKNDALAIIAKDQLEMEEQFGDIKKDSDVIDEENRILNLTEHNFANLNQNEIFVADRLTKYYSNFMAVKGISFSVKKSESFGLLGVNGAGKTTTFKMITGDETITKGDAFLNKVNIKDDIKFFQKQLGYCPQFDPLIDQMTVYETMELFANLRGIKPQYIRKTCLSLINLLDLNDHIKKMCYTLSGGNKRKLSVALALVGSPVVILLDEPTS